MELKQLVKVDRLSSVHCEHHKGDHTVEDEALDEGFATDDLTGEELDPALARQARKEEMADIHDKERKYGPASTSAQEEMEDKYEDDGLIGVHSTLRTTHM